MPSIIPNFQYDIFISYRHNDNRSGWVTEFVKALQEELASTIKEPISVYFDVNPHDGLLETHNVDKSLEGKLKCLIFIPIISQTYCDTKSFAWEHEFCVFNKLAKEDQFGRDIKLGNGNVASRILPIKIHDLDVEDKSTIENEIGGALRAIEFIFKSPGVNRPLTPADKREENSNKTFYRDQTNKTANAIKEIISAVKNPSQRSWATNNDQTQTPPVAKRKFVLITLGLLIILVSAYFIYPKLAGTQGNELEGKSIAVLPFADLSEKKDQEYFSDGLSEELLNLLSKIPELKVIGRTSSFSFKGKNEDLRIIGDKLGVAHILEGSVQKEGNKIRVIAQLIRTADGSHLWSERYDRDLEAIFKLQDEIAGAVVKQLKLKLLTAPSNAASSSTNTEVYNLILQGNYFVVKRDKESLAKALDFYLTALALDSLNARSWAAVGHCYILQSNWLQIDRKEGFQKARIAANKSVDLDDTQAEGHYALGLLKMWDFDWAGAEAEYQKVLDLEPGNADALRSRGFLYRCIGRFDEAIRLTKQSITLDPVQGHTYFNFGQLLYHANHLEEAIEAYKKVLELNPQFPRTHVFLGKVYLLQGKHDLALAEMLQEAGEDDWKSFGLILAYEALGRKKEVDKLLSDYIARFSKDNMFQIAEIYAVRGEKDIAFEYLEKSYIAREARLTYLKGDPLLKNLEGDSRHRAFLKKMNLPVD